MQYSYFEEGNKDGIVVNGEKFYYHHTSYAQGYVSTKLDDGIIKEYKGRFGTGYTIERNNPNSTMYCFKSYYVKK